MKKRFSKNELWFTRSFALYCMGMLEIFLQNNSRDFSLKVRCLLFESPFQNVHKSQGGTNRIHFSETYLNQLVYLLTAYTSSHLLMVLEVYRRKPSTKTSFSLRHFSSVWFLLFNNKMCNKIYRKIPKKTNLGDCSIF